MVSSSSHPALGSTRGESIGFLTYQSMSALLHSGVTVTSRSFGVEDLEPSVEISFELCHFSSSINFSSVFQVSSGICHKSIQTLYSSGTMLVFSFTITV